MSEPFKLVQARGKKLPWEEFNRFHHAESFFAIVDRDGYWEDSAISFDVAIYWVCMANGHGHLETLKERVAYVSSTTWSIIHSSMLKKMYEEDLIK